MIARDSPTRLGYAGVGIIALFGLSLFLIGLGGNIWVLTQHEAFAAAPAREMLRDGHWIIQTYGGLPRLNKTPAMGWIIAACMAVFASESEWVVRLPTALAAVGVALLVASIGSRHLGRTLGITAGLCQLTFYYVLKQGRLAEADMLLGLTVCAAMWAWDRGCVPAIGDSQSKRSAWLPIVFWCCLGLATLLKGPIGPLFALAGVLAYVISVRWIHKRKSPSSTAASVARPSWKFLLHPLGVVAYLAIVLPWPILAYRQHPKIWNVWFRETAGRFAGDMGGAESWYFYFWNVPLALLPWTLFVVIGAWVLWRRSQTVSAVSPVDVSHFDARRQDGPNHLSIFLASWFVPGFVMLCFSAWKHMHYAIPILPALSIPCAVGMVAFMKWAQTRPVVTRRIAMMSWAIGCAIGAWAATRYLDRVSMQAAAIIGMLAVGGLVALWREHRHDLSGQLAAVFATGWAIAVAVQLMVMPAYDGYRSSAELGRLASRVVPVGQPIFLLNLGEAHVVYYLVPRVIRFEKEAASRLDAWLSPSHGNEAFVIAAERTASRLEAWGSVERLGEAEVPVKGKLVFLRFSRNALPSGSS